MYSGSKWMVSLFVDADYYCLKVLLQKNNVSPTQHDPHHYTHDVALLESSGSGFLGCGQNLHQWKKDRSMAPT